MDSSLRKYDGEGMIDERFRAVQNLRN